MEEAIEGLWRDGENLVIDRQRARFPRRCIWTNEPIGGELTPLKIAYRPELGWEFRWSGMRYAHGPWENAVLQVPIGNDWKGTQDARTRGIGRIVLSVGTSALLLTIVGCIVASFGDMNPAGELPGWLTPVLIVTVGAGLVTVWTLPVGLLWPFLEIPGSRQSALKVPYFDEQYAWIPGVHSRFLAGLPAWQGPTAKEKTAQPAEQSEASSRRSFLHAAVGIGLIILVAALRAFVRAGRQKKPEK